MRPNQAAGAPSSLILGILVLLVLIRQDPYQKRQLFQKYSPRSGDLKHTIAALGGALDQQENAKQKTNGFLKSDKIDKNIHTGPNTAAIGMVGPVSESENSGLSSGAMCWPIGGVWFSRNFRRSNRVPVLGPTLHLPGCEYQIQTQKDQGFQNLVLPRQLEDLQKPPDFQSFNRVPVLGPTLQLPGWEYQIQN